MEITNEETDLLPLSPIVGKRRRPSDACSQSHGSLRELITGELRGALGGTVLSSFQRRLGVQIAEMNRHHMTMSSMANQTVEEIQEAFRTLATAQQHASSQVQQEQQRSASYDHASTALHQQHLHQDRMTRETQSALQHGMRSADSAFQQQHQLIGNMNEQKNRAIQGDLVEERVRLGQKHYISGKDIPRNPSAISTHPTYFPDVPDQSMPPLGPSNSPPPQPTTFPPDSPSPILSRGRISDVPHTWPGGVKSSSPHSLHTSRHAAREREFRF